MVHRNDPTLGQNPVNQPFIDFLTLDGVPILEGGSVDANVDGSTTPVLFKWVSPTVPPADQISHVQFINFVIQDRRKIIDPFRFGGIPTLDTGIVFRVVDDQGDLVFAGGALRRNRDFYISPDSTQTVTQNSELVRYRFDFQSAELRLKFLPLWGIELTINDDLTSLDMFNIAVSGRRETPSIPI